jgi:hypothetical protein
MNIPAHCQILDTLFLNKPILGSRRFASENGTLAASLHAVRSSSKIDALAAFSIGMPEGFCGAIECGRVI